MRELQKYKSLDSIVNSIVDIDDLCGVYSSEIYPDRGLLSALLNFKKYGKYDLIFAVSGFIIVMPFIIAEQSAHMPGVSIIGLFITYLLWFVILYIKSKTIKPSILAITAKTVYLFTEVKYDKEEDKYTYGNINICKRNELSHNFTLKALNPLYNMQRFQFCMKDSKYLIIRSFFKNIIYRGDYPKNKALSYKELRTIVKEAGDENNKN